MHFKKIAVALCATLVCLLGNAASAEDRVITVASTTSTEQSGLFGYILPIFEKESGIKVRVVALGTGQALDTARRGDADVAFVHDKAAEEKFVAEGSGVERREVMYNDFVLIGPKSDPAKTTGKDILEGLRRIAAVDAASRPPFVSRGDRSGTHAAELRYWKAAGLDTPSFASYRGCGCGMGPALNIASSTGAYVLTDRGTWLNFSNRADLVILVEGDKQLFNQYGVLPVNPAKHPHVNAAGATRFADWVTSPAGQSVIASYKIGGEQLFFPNAKP